MLTTGLDGARITASASAIASSTPGPAVAVSAPTNANDFAGTAARCLTHHSWKWMAFVSPSSSTTTCVSTRSSDIGSSFTPGFHRSHSASATADSG